MNEIDFKTNAEKYGADLLEEVRLFSDCYDGAAIRAELYEDGRLRADVYVGGDRRSFDAPLPAGDALEIKRLTKRFIKLALYDTLSAHYGVSLPWGSLTGVRPTKLAYEYLRRGGSADSVAGYLTDTFRVSPGKAAVVADIIAAQSGYIGNLGRKVNLYVHIPFCDGRCAYCSFPSADMNRHAGLLGAYLEKLNEEIREVKTLIASDNLDILSVYVGGGTPSVLTEKQIAELMEAIDVRGAEFTFEAGRPDSITDGKLAAIADGGADRLCLNPQTLNDDTLARIGRRHTSAQFFDAFEAARRYGFSVNTDIIAGLEGETFADFTVTADKIREMSPDNVTVHTLSRKRCSELADRELHAGNISAMTDYAYTVFSDSYRPYYLYRQKNMLGNLENIGYSLPGKECVNNITVMEELVPVYACGAGSISKKIVGGVISRHASPKDPRLYVSEFGSRLEAKKAFFAGA